MDIGTWGPAVWTHLHTVSLAYPDEPSREHRMRAYSLLIVTSETLPCMTCASHMRMHMWEHEMRSHSSPHLDSRERFVSWVFHLHDAVNARIGKPLYQGGIRAYLKRFPPVLDELRCGEERCNVSMHIQPPLPVVTIGARPSSAGIWTGAAIASVVLVAAWMCCACSQETPRRSPPRAAAPHRPRVPFGNESFPP
jgi:hypothetical protein